MTQIIIKEYKNYKESEVLPIYRSVGWSVYVNSPDKLQQAYEHSLYILGAYIEEQLVGLIRVVGDGISIIFIQDLLVHADHQRLGIGKQLIQAVLDKYKDVRQKALLTEGRPSQQAFYRSAGFVPIQETNGICFVRYTF